MAGRLCAYGFLSLLLLINTAFAQINEYVIDLNIPGNSYSKAVSIEGTLAVVGAPEISKVLVYRKTLSGWHQTAQITSASNSTVNFGSSLKLNGDLLIVGTNRPISQSHLPGKAFIFRRLTDSQWTQEATFSSTIATDQFGCAVDIEGSYAVVGAKGHGSQGSPGAVYVYKETTPSNWTLHQQLIPENIASNRLYGTSLALSGQYIAIGAALTANAVYIWKQDSNTSMWSLGQTLGESNGYDWLGGDVDIDGPHLVYSNRHAYNQGRAYTYQLINNQWIKTQTLYSMPPYNLQDEEFGRSVAVSEDRIVIGTTQFNHVLEDWPFTGGRLSVFDFKAGQWTLSHNLYNDDTKDFSIFGASVDISGNHFIAGDNWHQTHAYSVEEWVYWPGLYIRELPRRIPKWVPRIGDDFTYEIAMRNPREGSQTFRKTIFLEKPDGNREPLVDWQEMELAEYEISIKEYELNVPGEWMAGTYRVVIAWEEENGSYEHSFSFEKETESSRKQDAGIDEESDPKGFALIENYPNPFNPTTTIRYQLFQDAEVTLEIYNTLGQQIATLLQQKQTTGYHHVKWDGHNQRGQQVGSGIYLYRLQAGNKMQSGKMLLSR